MPRVYVPSELTVVHNGETITVTPGLQQMPNDLAQHWWLRANGVVEIPAVRPTNRLH